MIIIDGKKVAEEIKLQLKSDVALFTSQGGKTPHLAAILVGENPASIAYVNNKVKSCADAGFKSSLIKRNGDITESELIQLVESLNKDEDIDGFIVQLPLPKHIDELTVTMAIDPAKDVDGFHPVNFGKMAQGLPCFLPATPFGITLLLQYYNIETSGQNVVVVGRSHIVGTPMSILLSRKGADATVTLTHSKTKDLNAIIRQADIVIAAIGIPHFIREDMVKDGAVVIDVGINRVEDDTAIKGYKLVGDVDFENVAPKCSFITPVPGGVGPMTVVSLMKNTFIAAFNK
ncbi:MAG: bifunctional 5,10-methylenetetrahydrofolate dehydrogenase/5,10-methenyltetrahydrofolate cyclohydrolase [Saprospiraceae bacterium]